MGIPAEIIKAFWIIFPAYAANMAPLLLKGKIPLDFGKNLRTHRIFGNGKTIEGTIVGILAGTAVGAVEMLLYPSFNLFAAGYGHSLPEMTVFIGFMIALGAILGDIVASFFKRRANLGRGSNVPLLDQLDFVIGAVIFAYWFTDISLLMIGVMLVATPLIHRSTCMIGYKLKMKREPW